MLLSVVAVPEVLVDLVLVEAVVVPEGIQAYPQPSGLRLSARAAVLLAPLLPQAEPRAQLQPEPPLPRGLLAVALPIPAWALQSWVPQAPWAPGSWSLVRLLLRPQRFRAAPRR